MRLSVFIKIFIILMLLMVITISVTSPATVKKGHMGGRKVILNEAYGVPIKVRDDVINSTGYAALIITAGKLSFFGVAGRRILSGSEGLV
jgi:hypothetical protein